MDLNDMTEDELAEAWSRGELVVRDVDPETAKRMLALLDTETRLVPPSS